MSRLTPRLEAALQYISGSEVFADIGSDHAHLAVEAVKSGRAKSAVASEIREGPLMRSRLSTADIDGITCVLSDGFDNLRPYGIDCAAICGMGGETIVGILSRAYDLRNVKLILQPQCDQETLRAYLWNSGFEITSETFVTEGTRDYCVMCVGYTGRAERYSASDTYLGQLRPQNDSFRAYAARIGRYVSDLQCGSPSIERQYIIDECRLINGNMSIVLASASPRRRDICMQLGLDISIIPSSSEAEYDMSLSPRENMLRIAASKADEVSKTHSDDIVLGADTLVLSPDGEPLGKPHDEHDAFRMLKKLSGTRHSVMTGVCIIRGEKQNLFCTESSVWFKLLSDDEINAYIATGEPFGKAGAYAIQGIGGDLVQRIEGSLTNIIGLPREETAHELLKFCD